jgi:hypothetical protein
VSEAQLHNYPQEVVALRRKYALVFLKARQRDVTWTNRSKGRRHADFIVHGWMVGVRCERLGGGGTGATPQW